MRYSLSQLVAAAKSHVALFMSCCWWTQRYSATFATRSQSWWVGCRDHFIRQWPPLYAGFSSHV